MKYSGQFSNINNKSYQVDIITNNDSTQSTQLTFSSEPFKVELNSDKTIYQPLKLSNATCGLVVDDYYLDIYSSTAQGTKLTLTNSDNNTVEWVGYVTPNIYTQNFEQQLEDLQIEAIDGLSTLDNYQYKQIDYINKKIISFEDIIIQCIKQCNCYSNIYVNQNNTLTGSTNIINKLFIPEQNFFNDDAQAATDTTAAVAATSYKYKEVLSQIMQFLGYTITAYGNSVYILDYDYIKSNNTNYIKYSTSNNWSSYSTSQVILNDINDITGDSFKANGATIELDTTYNQVSVKSVLNNKDSILPDFFDDTQLTNISITANNQYLWNDYVLWFDNGYTYYNKYYKHNQYITTWYVDDNNWQQLNFDYTTYPILKNNIGALVSRQAYFETAKGTDSVSFSNIIQLFRHQESNPTTTQNLLKPVLYNIAGSVPQNSYLYDTFYIIIGGSACWTNMPQKWYIDQTEDVGDDTSFSEDNLYLTATLQIGNKYWNGTAWTTTASTFKIQFKKGDESHLMNKWFSVKNQVSYQDFISETGQKIPIKTQTRFMVTLILCFTPHKM